MPFTLLGDESAVAHLLLDAAGATAEHLGRPVWAKVRNLPAGRAEVALRADDFDGLGWLAPPVYDGIGLVATGRLRQLDRSLELPASLASGLGGRVRMACVVFRSGRVGWHMVLADGSWFDETPQEGRMLDLLRRCLALPTPPPAVSLAPLYDSVWLATVLDGARPGRLLSWSELLARHPLLEGRTSGLAAPLLEQLVDALTNAQRWDDLRMAVAAGSRCEGLPSPDLAAWMDDGMFSRWVLDSIRPTADLLAELRPWLRPSACRHLAHWVRGRQRPL